MKLDLGGCGSVLPTPFDVAGRIDFGALGRLIDWQIREGVDFLVVGTPDGESPTLSGDDRRAIAANAVRFAAGRVPVIAGAGGNHTAKSVFWARDAEKSGAAAILAVTPSYNLPTPDGLLKHFSAISDASRLPVIVGNLPARTGEDVDPDTMARLAEIPRVAGIVEATPNFRKVAALLAALPENFPVFSGDDSTCLAALALGMKGVFSLAAAAIPGPVSAMIRNAAVGRWDEARATARRHAGLIDALHLETSPGPIKGLLAMMGRCGETLRLPLAPLREENRRRLEKAARALKLVPRSSKP